jgi:D-alanyl-D-alanine carboxypeptidase (penicillin-binding protein 5/6)
MARLAPRLLSPLLAVGLLGGALAAPAGSAAAEEPGGVVGGELLGSSDVVVRPGAGATRLPRLTAASWVLADAATGDVLAARDPHGKRRPASTLKILTALTLLDRLDRGTTYRARFEDAAVEGSRVGVVPDATYTVHNLFEGMFLMSGNDAANALANAAGGVRQTVAAMNETAAGLGALDTTARNPSGLDAPGQVSSAYDLTLLARAGLDREDFRAYAATVRSTFPGAMPKRGKKRRTFEIWTQDRLLTSYRGAIGIKTGWTSKAKGTFVGAATRGDRTLVATVMRTGQRSWEESAALLDWGFANADRVTPVGTLDQPAPEPPAEEAAPSAQAVGAAPTSAGAAPAADGSGMPVVVWVLAVLAGSVVALRARVLLRARRRRAGYRLTRA